MYENFHETMQDLTIICNPCHPRCSHLVVVGPDDGGRRFRGISHHARQVDRGPGVDVNIRPTDDDGDGFWKITERVGKTKEKGAKHLPNETPQ